ncbi:MAG: acetate kinase [Oscillospiraceae bacterium]|nr:acetate kinase [Oscillospiraceae bacterium]
MKILVINAGSSSLKYQLIDMDGEVVLAKGICERIGEDGGNIVYKTGNGKVIKKERFFFSHTEAFEELVNLLTTGDAAVVSDIKEISAVGHRVVQGAEKFSQSVIIDQKVLDAIIEVSPLAPLHNPAAVAGIKACMEVFPKETPMVAVFDTAFHQTMPEKAYIFGIPYEYYEKYHIRRYGFHGTSHRYISAKVAENIGRPIEELKIVTCHLGNGSSIAAVDHGKSIDTSMGFTPLDGIMMGTRSGGIDPSIIIYLEEKEGLSYKEINNILNKKSGFIGVSGYSSDSRDIVDASLRGEYRSKLACDIVRYQVKKYVGAYAAAMGGIDVLAFAGGIGENSLHMRSDVCKNMEFLGIKIDEEANIKYDRTEHDISAPDARVRTWIIATNEELLIARDAKDLISK